MNLKPKEEPGVEIDSRYWEAAWRFQLIAPFVNPGFDEEQKAEHRSQLGKNPVTHPFRGPITLAPRTIRRWCQKYRKCGLQGLVPAVRGDQGTLRILPVEALELSLKLREEDGRRSVPQLIRLLIAKQPEWEGVLARSSLDRHLRARGSKKQRTTKPEGPFRTFEAKEPNELWQGDILHGPVVICAGGVQARCRVVCWLDDHSRYVCHLEAYADERLPAIEDSLKKAILKYGSPSRIFVDNAWVYSGKSFTLACGQLGIHKIHSTPRYPVSRGKQERFFRSLREQLLIEVENREALTLEKLNRYLVAWVDKYHQTTHSSTDMTPEARFVGRQSRLVSTETLEESFWQWTTRCISSTGELKFAGNVYRVDPSFAGRKMVIRYEPYDISRVYLWEGGRKVAVASPQHLLHQVRRGTAMAKRNRESTAASVYLEGLEAAHEKRLQQELNLTQYPTKEEQ